MGHYDECRPGYCGACGAAPGNIINGKCQFCHPPKATAAGQKAQRKTRQKAGLTLAQALKKEAK